MPGTLTFRDAFITEAPELSRLATRSKAYWGYPAEFMRACEQELTVSAAEISATDNHFVVAIDRQELIGFYALERMSEGEIELIAMFVEPQYIGKGVGRQLMQQAINHAVQLGAKRLTIQSDPHAQAFYQAAGAEPCGERESGSIPGRFLPILQIELPVSDFGHADQAS